jgi:hypothetical protein
VLLQLAVGLAVQLVNPLGRLVILDERADQEVGALPDLFVTLDPRHLMPHLLERSRLDAQIIRVHQRPVHVADHDPCHFVRPFVPELMA